MIRPWALPVVLALVAAVLCGGVCAAAIPGSALALPMLDGSGVPRLTIAQRTITRAWGPSEDSTYVEVDVPDWKSEGFAAAASALVPGSGQWYVGESSALWFMIAEVAGWTAHFVFKDHAEEYRSDAETFAGNPADSASTWSFDRWEATTGDNSVDLRRVYNADPDAFYHNIAYDPVYTPGWEADTEASRLSYKSIYDQSQRYEKRARYAGGALWINHLVAAVDALHAARVHNLPIRNNLTLKVNSGWSAGPRVRATLERKF
jgi:hypothetical protein